jgi:hypothetical protein
MPQQLCVRSSDPVGEADIVVQSIIDNSLVYFYAAPGAEWTSSQVAGESTTFSAPSIAVRFTDPVGEADIVAQGPNNSLVYYHATPGAEWTSSVVAGPGTTFSAPSIFVRSTDPVGEADIVAQGDDGSLMYYWATPGNSWSSSQVAVPGSAISGPSIFVRSVDPVGEADIVVQVGDQSQGDTVMYYHATPGNPWYSDVVYQWAPVPT